MTDDLRMIVVERRIAEHVIRMHVRVDDEAHRQGRERADRRAQRAPDDIAAAGVDYSDAARADDEAHIGNVAIVVAGDVGQLAVMNVDARCRILERQARGVGASRARRDGSPRMPAPATIARTSGTATAASDASGVTR